MDSNFSCACAMVLSIFACKLFSMFLVMVVSKCVFMDVNFLLRLAWIVVSIVDIFSSIYFLSAVSMESMVVLVVEVLLMVLVGEFLDFLGDGGKSEL